MSLRFLSGWFPLTLPLRQRLARAGFLGSFSILAVSGSGNGEDKSSWFSVPQFKSLDKIRDAADEWKERLDRIVTELSRDEGSLYRRLLDKDRFDASIHHEITLDASVRLDQGQRGPESLPHAEKAFLRQRTKKAAKAFAKYIDVDESEVDPRDLPVIGIAGSGGGYRAMVNLAGNLKAAKDAGLFDCVMYLASISGGSWGSGLLYSIARGDIDKWHAHIRKNIQTPFLHPSILDPLTTAPTNAYLLASPVFKEAAKDGSTGLVDAYGLVVSARLFQPDDRKPDSRDLKISEQRRFFEQGELPMPIYNLVWHNVPAEQLSAEQRDGAKKASNGVSKMHDEAAASDVKDRWLWFEATSFEVGSEEIGAYCPTYAFGRRFDRGKSIERQPELQLTVLNGLFASAFTATLFQYITEVKPVMQMLGTTIFGRLDSLLSSYKDDLLKLHPVPPASIPNFTKNIGSKLRKDAPKELNEAEMIGLLDAGSYCNLPYYPLFRRQCDVILAFDASADSQELWFERAQKYAAARDLSGWPRIRFPGKAPAEAQKQAQSAISPAISPAGDQASDSKEVDQDKSSHAAVAEKMPAPEDEHVDEQPLGRCAIWVGSTDNQPSRLDDPTTDEVVKRDGIALAYFQLTGDEGLKDPASTWSTWKFEYTPEETDALLSLAHRSFSSADTRLRTLLKGVWMRKRRDRLAKGS